MTNTNRTTDPSTPTLPKAPTGIDGLDEIIGGGLPKGRPTLVCGSAGCGKTLLAIEFLVRGATEFGEPGVLMAFEETADELTQNVRSLGFDLQDLVAQKKLVVDYVYVERSEIDETGEYDLEGLFIRLGHAIASIGAKRVVLDTIESLFSGLANTAILRAELRRLFRWLKDKGVTAIITGERGDGALTRNGLEEYVSDCVILLDHRVTEQLSTRRLRIVKYRGSTHGTNEFPFLIGESGISVLPITSVGLDHPANDDRVSSGVAALDVMLDGQGFFRGASILVSGAAGTGKTSVAAQFAVAACARGERCLFFAFEESPSQLVRNMRSIGLDLECWVKEGLLIIRSVRPTLFGLESHLTVMIKMVKDLKPQAIIVDPVTSLLGAGAGIDVRSMLVRLIDLFKMQGVTSLFTSLTHGGENEARSEAAVSSLIDTWLMLHETETNGERRGLLSILKSRGMAHSKKISGFRLTNHGIALTDADLPAVNVRKSRLKGGGK